MITQASIDVSPKNKTNLSLPFVMMTEDYTNISSCGVCAVGHAAILPGHEAYTWFLATVLTLNQTAVQLV